MPSIIDLPGTVASLSEAEKELFYRFFRIKRGTGRLVLPKEMKEWAKKTFGNPADVEEQRIVKVLDIHVYEESLFNELRAKRPMQVKEKENLQQIIAQSEGGPFSKPLSMTPADTFGRIKGRHCVSASNVAKYDGTHGLIIFKKHDPLDFNEKEVQDYFKTALKWFKKAYKSNKKAVYPFLLWNCLWRAAASIVHGHMQLVLGEGFHYADAENDKKAIKEYHNKYECDFFSDLYKVHELIGLGFETKEIKVFASIVPREDKQVTIISKKLDKTCVNIIYKVVQCLKKDFGVMSFNLGTVFPPLNNDPAWKDFPVITRIVDRGKLSNKTTDIGGMEIYDMGNVILTDPYRVIEKVKGYF
ncbi:hypothetical protein KY348_02885 [Candidatus Woesearchaeota archaeon]|nr:hypothetical protein [Candidatus Woesearchaeota archaeon]